MDWISNKSFRLGRPYGFDEIIGRFTFEGFEPRSEIIGHKERMQMFLQFFVACVVIPADSCLFNGSVHSLNLAVGPGMFYFGLSVFDPMSVTNTIKRRHEGHNILFPIAELDAIVG